MSELNSQIKIQVLDSIKEPNETKTSLEKLNNLLQDLKNKMKESSTLKKSSIKEERNKIEPNNLQEDSGFIPKESLKKEKDENINDKDKVTSEDVGDNNNDRISNANIKKMQTSGDYKNSSDINYINYINYLNNKIEEDNPNNPQEELNNINEDNIDNINTNNNEDKNTNQYFNEVNVSYIAQNLNDINSFNIMTKASEQNLNNIIKRLDGEEVEEEKENENDEFYSLKIDPDEKIDLGLTSYQISNEKSITPSTITNELNKAIIRTFDYTKSKDAISNIDSELPREEEKEKSDNKSENKSLPKKNSKTSNINNINNTKDYDKTKDNNYDKKSAIDELLKPEPKKNENIIIKENKEKIQKEIDSIYETELNLVKINNKEKFSYITKYNNPDKDKLGYESDYYLCNKNSINYLNRRNNFLNKKYFSYILTKEHKKKTKCNNNKEKSKEKEDYNNSDINDNFIYNEEIIKKFKKKYNEKIEKITIDLNFIRALSNNEVTKEHKINDIEDIISFYYYFKLYSPENGFNNNLESKSENDILKNFNSYRKILNDGNSFKRGFAYLLIENLILKNQIKKYDYLIYDIKRMMEKKYSSEIKQICNTLIDIKENSSIDYLMNSFNNPNINFDEIMINYIEYNLKKVLDIDINKNKYIEIDQNSFKILANIFDVNIEIYYIEKDQNNFFKLNNLIIYNDNFIKTKKNVKASSYSDFDCSTTFHFLFFLNSYYIIYTEKSDIDSTLANSLNERQYYYIDTLPSYKCPNCNKNTGLDIIPSYEAIFCHVCLIKYLKEVLEKRVVLFIKSNFSCIEYYTRPIKITSDIIINYSLYKYITNNYIINDFEKILEKICFKCYDIIEEKNKIKKMKCLCQFCEKCIEKILKENLKDKNWLNKYELHNIKKNKCLCGNDLDLQSLIKIGKNKPSEKDKKMAEDRLLNIIKKKCCLCLENNSKKLFDFKILVGSNHLMCFNCNNKEINDNSNENTKDNSKDNIINNKKNNNRKIFCKICYEEHHMIEEKIIQKIPEKCKCCKENCNIF